MCVERRGPDMGGAGCGGGRGDGGRVQVGRGEVGVCMQRVSNCAGKMGIETII